MRTVLIVDDEPGLLRALRCYLMNQGYAVRTATNGLDALRQLQTEPIHLVLVDQNLPGKTGLEILRHLNQAASEVPVILMSALLNHTLGTAARLLGAKACLQKPFTLCGLKSLVEKELGAPRETGPNVRWPDGPIVAPRDCAFR